MPQYASTSVMDEANAIQITLGADLIENNRISLNLDQDGATYVISGSNYINDAYVDTTITVPGRTTVHVIFDGVDIKKMMTEKSAAAEVTAQWICWTLEEL